MHSALPRVATDVKNTTPHVKMNAHIYKSLASAACALVVLIYLLTSSNPLPFVSSKNALWGKPVYYKGDVRANADTVGYSTSQYIYPELKDLKTYRDGQWMLNGGKYVDSRTNSIIYNGAQPPRVVMVIGLDDSFSQEYLENVLQDRLDYAQKHGFGLYARYIRDFATTSVNGAEDSTDFAKILLIREAMYAFKDSQWVWWLDQDAVIMNHSFNIEDELLDPAKLQPKMTRDVPIIPPESIIHTYKRVPASNVKFILSQNDRGMSSASMLIMNDELYGKVLMGYWSDPLHRSYPGFAGFTGLNGPLEASLTHMVQWHPAILSRMTVVPHKYLGSRPQDGSVLKDQKYNDGDFVYLVRDGNELEKPGTDKITKDWNDAFGRRNSKNK